MYFITVSGGERKECTEKTSSQSRETVMGSGVGGGCVCLTASLTQTKANAGLSQALASHVDRS